MSGLNFPTLCESLSETDMHMPHLLQWKKLLDPPTLKEKQIFPSQCYEHHSSSTLTVGLSIVTNACLK